MSSSSESEEEVVSKGSRKVPKPSRYNDSVEEDGELEASMKNKKASVKCNQTGKTHTVKIQALSKEDATSIIAEDLEKGSQLLMEFEKKTYPVTVLKVVPNSKTTLKTASSASKAKSGRKRPSNNDDAPQDTKLPKITPKSLGEALEAAKESLIAKDEDSDQECIKDESLLDIKEQLGINTKKLDTIISLLQKKSVNNERGTSSLYIVNGVDLMNIPARDAYSYGRGLLDVIFTKEEQKNSTVLKSQKSLKPPLSPGRVQKLFDCVDKRYPNHDRKRLIASLGQKCRDAKVDVVIDSEEED